MADGRQMLMLFNENVVILDKFMNMTEKQSFKDINCIKEQIVATKA